MDPVGVVYIAMLLVTTSLGILMLIYSWQRRDAPGGRPVVAMLVMVVFWAACVLSELASSRFQTKLVFFNLRQISLTSLPILWLVMSVEVHRQDVWRNRWLLVLLFAWPTALGLLSVTNHPLMRESLSTVTSHDLTIITSQRGPWALLETAYSYAMILIGIVLLIDLLRRTVASQRHQTITLILGICFTFFGNLIDQMGLNPIYPLNLLVIMFVPASFCWTWGLFRRRLLDVLPVAHDRVLEAIADGVMVVNSAGTIVGLNRAAHDIFARTLPNQHEILGRPVVEALADWKEWQVSTPEPRSCFEVTYGTEPNALTFDVAVTTLRTPRGALMGQVMLINDVTAEKQTFMLLAERERIEVLQKFLRDASHDLRTPMSVIQSSAYLMKRIADKQIETLATLHPRLPQVYASIVEAAIDMTGKVRDRAVAADDAAKRLWSILQGMFELAELEAVSMMEKQRVDINLIVEMVVRARFNDIERHGVTVQTSLDRSIPMLIADEKRLHRAIDAVIINAIQYTPAQGAVDVRTLSNNGHACIEVKDTGIGITTDDMPRIFDRFFRADASRSTETGGAGLGLTLAKAIIDAHAGSIDVASVPGSGSTFTLRLPMTLA